MCNILCSMKPELVRLCLYVTISVILVVVITEFAFHVISSTHRQSLDQPLSLYSYRFLISTEEVSVCGNEAGRRHTLTVLVSFNYTRRSNEMEKYIQAALVMHQKPSQFALCALVLCVLEMVCYWPLSER